MTTKSDSGQIAKAFVSDLIEANKKYPGENLSPTDPRIINALMEMGNYETRSVLALLFSQEKLMIQKRLPVAKTPLGFTKEFRVDFIDGEPVRGVPRYTHEYMPDEAAKAQKFLSDFFKNAPENYRYLSGGADIVFLKNGELKIIEFNFGGSSGFMDPSHDLFFGSQYMTALLGQPNGIMKRLNDKLKAPLDEQIRFLENLGKDPVFKTQWQEYFCSNVAFYFRDDYLETWGKNPSSEAAQAILAKVKRISKYLNTLPGREEDAKMLVESTKSFFRQKGYTNLSE